MSPTSPLLKLLHLDDEGAALDGVDEDIAGREAGIVAPGADEVDDAAVGQVVVLGVDVEEGDFLDAGAGGVRGDGAHVEHAQARAVVALVAEPVEDVLVVVDRVGLGLVDTRLLRVFQVRDVEDVRHREAVGGRARVVFLVELVVDQQVGLPVQVQHPALVRVAGADVRGLGDDGRRVDAEFVRDVVDRQRVFVVAVADLLALVSRVGSVVDDALRVVHVSVLASASGRPWVGDVCRVDEDDTRTACAVSWLGAHHGDPIGAFWALHNVVSTADGQVVE